MKSRTNVAMICVRTTSSRPSPLLPAFVVTCVCCYLRLLLPAFVVTCLLLPVSLLPSLLLRAYNTHKFCARTPRDTYNIPSLLLVADSFNFARNELLVIRPFLAFFAAHLVCQDLALVGEPGSFLYS